MPPPPTGAPMADPLQMTDLIFGLVADYGTAVVFVVTFLSCLALPVPSSLLMLSAGGFAATGDLSLTTLVLAAASGAVLGDNAGYWLARGFGARLRAWLAHHPERATLLDRSAAMIAEHGGLAVFFSRWLVSPLGPSMNYVCGLTQFSWPRFVLWGSAGELVWVGVYVGAGYAFAGNLTAIAALTGNASGFVTALVLVLGFGWWLRRAYVNHRKSHGRANVA